MRSVPKIQFPPVNGTAENRIRRLGDIDACGRFLQKREGADDLERRKRKLLALDALATAAAAWNKSDNFTPDYGTAGRLKFYPCFKLDGAARRFVFDTVLCTTDCATAPFVFCSWRRAGQFGRKFADLYNEILP